MKASITKDLWTNQNVIKIQQWKISQWPSSWGFSENWSSSADDPLSEPSIEQKVAAEKIFSRDMIQLLEKVFAWRIKAIVPIMTFRTSTPTIIMGEESSAEIKVVENSFFAAKDIQAERGTLFTHTQIQNHENVAIISADIVSLFKNRDPIGKTIYINNSAFTIIGILPKTNDYMISGIYIPFVTATKRFGPQKIESIDVYAQDADMVEVLQKDLWYFLMKYSGAFDPTELNFNLFSNKKAIESYMKAINSIALFVSGIAAISLLVGGIGIMNIMLVSVTERTREIGIRKAIGAKRRDIVFQFLTESAILSWVGGIVAIIFSYIVGAIIHMLFEQINPLITVDIIILATSFSMIIGVVFGLLPAWKAAKMDAIEALRFE